MEKDYMGVTLGISGSASLSDEFDIVPDDVSVFLGLTATSGWKRGDIQDGGKYTNRKIIRRYGIWHYSTRGLLKSDYIMDHIKLILEIFDKRVDLLQHYIDDNRYNVRLHIWFEGYCGVSGFGIDKEILIKMMNICNDIYFVMSLKNEVDECISQIEYCKWS